VKSPASANASADQNVNMAEGMAPSLVNDGVRALMSSVAMWRDDTAGVTTAGSSTAYTVTTNQGFASLAALDGRKLAIIMHVSSGAAPTLSVDGLAAKPIRLATGVAVGAGVFVQGSSYTLVYSNASGEFLVRDQVAQTIPSGTVAPFAGSTGVPAGWLLCAGQTASQASFPALFAVIGTTYGPAAGGTFTLPDLRGRVIAGIDSALPGALANRITVANGNFDSTVLGGNNGNSAEIVTLTKAQIPPHDHDIQEPNSGQGHGHTITDNSGGPQQGQPVGIGGARGTGPGNMVDSLSGATVLIGRSPSGVTVKTTSGSGNGPGGGSHSNVQPTIVLSYIIKT
jgi:microcystin-dependent protein